MLRALIAIAASGFLGCSCINAQPVIEIELRDLKRGQLEILQMLRQLSERSGPNAAPSKRPTISTIRLNGIPFLGAASSIVLLEVSDFQCHFCQRHFLETFPSLKSKYVDTGLVAYGFAHLPNEKGHPMAMLAAEAASCAADQNLFWKVHDYLMAGSSNLDERYILNVAAAVPKIDIERFDACLSDDTRSSTIRKQRIELMTRGVTGTPAFLIGTYDRQTQVLSVIKLINGAIPLSGFEAAIKTVRAELDATQPASSAYSKPF